MIKYTLGDSMKNEFINELQKLNITLSDQQYNQFEKYFDLLIEWNEKINLTAITDKKEVFYKHFIDSICVTKVIDFNNQSLLDVGSGAGFPSIPLKIIFPDLKITIVDALNKRIKFLELLCKSLDIKCYLIHSRIEDFKFKNNFDVVTARAVANLRVLSEFCIPFVKPDGYFLSLKGPNYLEELEESKNAISILGGTFENAISYSVQDSKRVILKIKKIRKTENKYPRKYNKIKIKPL